MVSLRHRCPNKQLKCFQKEEKYGILKTNKNYFFVFNCCLAFLVLHFCIKIMSVLTKCLTSLPIALVKICADYAQFFDLNGKNQDYEKSSRPYLVNLKTGSHIPLRLFDNPEEALENLNSTFKEGRFSGSNLFKQVDLDDGFALTCASELYRKTKQGWKSETHGCWYDAGLCDNQLGFLHSRHDIHFLDINGTIIRVGHIASVCKHGRFWQNKIVYGNHGCVYSYSPSFGRICLVELNCPGFCELCYMQDVYVVSKTSLICFSGHWIAYYRGNEILWKLPYSSELTELVNCDEMWEIPDGTFICRIKKPARLSGKYDLAILEKNDHHLSLKTWKTNVSFSDMLEDGTLVVIQNSTKTFHTMLSHDQSPHFS